MPDLTVPELLEQSRAAHDEYRSNLPRMAAAGGGAIAAVGGDVVKAAGALERAASLRKQAYDLDPDRTDDAWTIDAALTGGPDVLLTWYAEHLAREDDAVSLAARRIAKREAPIDAEPPIAEPPIVVDPPIKPGGVG
jgi:hypothetical protein